MDQRAIASAQAMQSYISSLRNLREVVCCLVKETLTVPTGPYQVLLSPKKLALRLGVCVDTIANWRVRDIIPPPLEALNSTPTGRGRGNRWVRYDYWRVLRWLDGKRE